MCHFVFAVPPFPQNPPFSSSSTKDPKVPHLPDIQALPPPPPNKGTHVCSIILQYAVPV